MNASDLVVFSSMSDIIQDVLANLEKKEDLGIGKQESNDREVLVDTVIIQAVRDDIEGGNHG